jgi:hypothetical protein
VADFGRSNRGLWPDRLKNNKTGQYLMILAAAFFWGGALSGFRQLQAGVKASAINNIAVKAGYEMES